MKNKSNPAAAHLFVFFIYKSPSLMPKTSLSRRLQFLVHRLPNFNLKLRLQYTAQHHSLNLGILQATHD